MIKKKKKKSIFSCIIPDYKEVTHLSHNQAAHLPVRLLQLYLTEKVDPTHPPDELDGEVVVVVVVVVVMTMMVVVQEAQEVQGQEEEVKKVVQR